MFTIIRYNHVTKDAPVLLAAKSTLEDAKVIAEADVAAARANLTNKQYITWTIINARTGELVGAIADLPPSVTWK